MAYNLCGLGGTFDHLHEGHKLLISTAFKMGKNIAIGLTTEEMLRTKSHKEKIESYDTRRENIIQYVKSLNPDYINHCFIVPLKNVSGSAGSDSKIDIHISSEDTIMNALKINEERAKKGLKKMILVVVPLIQNSNGETISSTKIRESL